jgi:hypothetical protein
MADFLRWASSKLHLIGGRFGFPKVSFCFGKVGDLSTSWVRYGGLHQANTSSFFFAIYY